MELYLCSIAPARARILVGCAPCRRNFLIASRDRGRNRAHHRADSLSLSLARREIVCAATDTCVYVCTNVTRGAISAPFPLPSPSPAFLCFCYFDELPPERATTARGNRRGRAVVADNDASRVARERRVITIPPKKRFSRRPLSRRRRSFFPSLSPLPLAHSGVSYTRNFTVGRRVRIFSFAGRARAAIGKKSISRREKKKSRRTI